jgi:hypothetical protein
MIPIYVLVQSIEYVFSNIKIVAYRRVVGRRHPVACIRRLVSPPCEIAPERIVRGLRDVRRNDRSGASKFSQNYQYLNSLI